jgi:hypothetical protein
VSVAASAVPGGVRFAASGPNAPGVVTELLLQPLASGHRTPRAHAYRSERFAVFASSERGEVVPAVPGWWAAACRLVCAETGQCGTLTPLDVLRVL